MAARNKYIQTLVNNLLDKHKIKSAPINVEKIAQDLGLIVVYKPAKSNLSGFLYRDYNKNENIIGVNKNHPLNRRRFTIAHEIGHYLLHKYEGFHFDDVSLKMRDENSSTGMIKEEREANYFASELLMPQKFIEVDIVKYENSDLLFGKELPRLAKKYQVSNRSLTYRLTYLRII